MTRMFPTRAGKMVDCNETRSDEHGLHGYEPTLDRKSGKYIAVPIFIPVEPTYRRRLRDEAGDEAAAMADAFLSANPDCAF